MRKLIAIIVMILFVSPVFAQENPRNVPQEAKIGDFEKFKEKLSLAVTFSKERKAEKMLNLAEKRLNVISSESTSPELVEEYQAYISAAEKLAEESGNVNLKENIEERKSIHISLLEEIYDQSSNDMTKYRIELVLSEQISELDESERIEHEKAQEIINKRKSSRIEIGSIESKETVEERIEQRNSCVQVIQPAINTQTQECRDFATPCDVPAGWEITSSCIQSSVSPEKPATPVNAGLPTEIPPNFLSGADTKVVDNKNGKAAFVIK